MGHECCVVAPSLVPRRPGDRIKTDRRDALSLARLHRSGDLAEVWVPDEEQEAIRDLVRCRADFKHAERRARQRLHSFLLRHGRFYSGRSRWTQAHYRWLATQRFAHASQQIAFEEYVDAVRSASRGDGPGRRPATGPGRVVRPVIRGLKALRGVDLLVGMTVMAEWGDLTGFDSPAQLMAYVGQVPREHTSGRSRRQGSITKTGNGHVRRVLTQAAWCYRFRAGRTRHLQRQAEGTSQRVQEIAWRAQKRLCGRIRHLTARGKPGGKVNIAVGRELLGFIWAIAWETMPSRTA